MHLRIPNFAGSRALSMTRHDDAFGSPGARP
ncbi:hypothetical protein FHX81_7326 [Saccharothrix saharensis]|uniref:Uncharacterized protein n=1 Tax=Saccharothrix saharensis TaxID=571190 RepID=A0A543JPV5_9PSEU|nr:hypothetical protein FHX81_7326 [Saccharothrix saharensis]